MAIQKDQRGAVLEDTVGGPFHADQLGSEHGEPRLSGLDDGSPVGLGVVTLLRSRSETEKRKNQSQSHARLHRKNEFYHRDASHSVSRRYVKPQSGTPFKSIAGNWCWAGNPGTDCGECRLRSSSRLTGTHKA